MTSKNIQESKVFQQYNKQLEAQNIAKNHEIQALKKEMDLIGLSQKIQALNVPVCQQCIRKQQQIQTLIKAIKSLRRTYSKSKGTLFSQDDKIQITSQLEKSISQKYVQTQQNANDTRPLFMSRQELKIMTKYNSKNKSNFSGMSNEAQQLQFLKQQTLNRCQQNEVLKKRLQFFQKKVIQLEQVNKILRQQIVKIKAQQYSNPYGLLSNEFSQPQTGKSGKRTPAFTAIRSQVVKTVQLPVETIIQPAVQIKTHKLQSNQDIKTNRGRFKQNPRNNCTCLDSALQVSLCGKKCSSRLYKSIDQDLIQQRRRSLKHKIKILEGENRKLRTQVFQRAY